MNRRHPARGGALIQRLREKKRRGIVLLVVISLLALFILMGITFALVSSGYRDASKLELLDQQRGDPPETEMDLVLGQILYDSAARTSLQYHSLLRDLYGYDDALPVSVLEGPQRPEGRDTVQGMVLNTTGNNAQNSGSSQLFTFQFNVNTSTSPNTALSPIHNYYAGRVITFRDGPAANHSSRVVAYQPQLSATQPALLTIESIESKLAGPVQPAQNNTFIINGAPFNGSGAGYGRPQNAGVSLDGEFQQLNPGGGMFQAVPSSLLPHYGAYQRRGDAIGYWASHPVDLGGMDETWDAPDMQNMFLAMVPPQVAANPSTPIIPSFHRPELVNYWMSNAPGDRAPINGSIPALGLAAEKRDFLRTFIFRPMPWDHPNFSGSNPNFAAGPGTTMDAMKNALTGENGTRNTWDVDNDNDGVPDSVWIDPGLPVVTSKDGRRYKRLCAILIKDLDGSINVNAHGNIEQVRDTTPGQYYRAEYALQPGMHPNYNEPNGRALGVAPGGSVAARGIGYGPAEVDLLRLFTNSTTPLTDANALQAARGVLFERYKSNSANDSGFNARPGFANFRDQLSSVKSHGVPSDYGNEGGLAFPTWYYVPNWYGSPPDVFGISTITLDYGGHPIWANAGRNVNNLSDSPYELSLNGEVNNTDTPYTAAELERLLRYHDPDAAQLPPRLLLAGNNLFSSESPGIIGASHARRNMTTTLSSHIPAPALSIPADLRKPLADFTASGAMKLAGNTTILDLYAFRLLNGGVAFDQLDEQMQQIVPFEFFKGQKFDLNRWLGDGVDNDGNGERDDPEESNSNEKAWADAVNTSVPTVPQTFQTGVGAGQAQHTNGLPFLNAGYTFPNDNLFARQMYAQQLFCLAMLFLPDTFQPDPPAVPPNYDAALAGTAGPPPPADAYRRLMIRRIAQWAVNCVDYRDTDSIMTPFEFDYRPFDNDGWAVDGRIDTTGDEVRVINGTQQTVSMNPLYRGLVWGMEQPELLISETLAFHDRRVKDTSFGSGGGMNQNRLRTDMTNPDETLDQFRMPQGSAFIELYSPLPTRWPNQVANQKPLHRNPTPLAIVDPATNRPRSIWRLAFSKICVSGNTDPSNTDYLESPWYRVVDANNMTPTLETSTFEPRNISFLPGTPPAAAPDRYAYFCRPIPNVEFPDRAFFVNDGSFPAIQPGQYAVVGPRRTTYLGSQDPSTANPAASPSGSLWGGDSQQYIQINPTNVGVFDTNGTTTTRTIGTQIRPPLGIVCDIANVIPETNGVAWSSLPPPSFRFGLNVTEPLPYPGAGNNYYPRPLFTAPYNDFYDNPEPMQTAGTFPGQPLDTDHSASVEAASNQGRPLPDLAATTGVQVTQTGTQLESTIYLQRLADPTRDFDAVANPYVTVDWTTMDVTVFSGEEHTNNHPQVATGDFDPDDPQSNLIRFRTRQRGFHGAMPASQYSPWSPATVRLGGAIPLAAYPDRTYFSVDLSNNRDGSFDPLNPDPDRHTLGYLNETIDQVQVPPNGYLGEPRSPAPWLTWNNRPFTNPMELLCVPSSSPARATFEMTQGGGFGASWVAGAAAGPGGTLSPYSDQGEAPGPGRTRFGFRAPFAGLLNFFYDSTVNGGPAPEQMHLCRLLDFVEVPSPYAGTERWYNPQWFGDLQGGRFYQKGNVQSPPGYTYPIPYRPPFNKLSRFRDPGRININTIYDEAVWDAAVGMFPGLTNTSSGGLFPGQVFASRQGYNPNSPTRFANPFRTADSSDLMPNAGGMRHSNPEPATLLRPGPQSGGAGGQQPLMQINQGNPQQLQRTGTQGAHQDQDRNPYFRYQPLQKIGNIFSTHSNCFAVWITMGYFEVEDSTFNPKIDTGHPDGLMLGQEVGADSGEITRHRAFYIIDRSIPVGFVPGSRLNTDDCVLVRRLIE